MKDRWKGSNERVEESLRMKSVLLVVIRSNVKPRSWQIRDQKTNVCVKHWVKETSNRNVCILGWKKKLYFSLFSLWFFFGSTDIQLTILSKPWGFGQLSNKINYIREESLLCMSINVTPSQFPFFLLLEVQKWVRTHWVSIDIYPSSSLQLFFISNLLN